ncbi:MAG: hypothetical protein KDA42_18100 [Planctomycetales bacterium]|nr:hypothetical protein [Planctomycetales bacterium]
MKRKSSLFAAAGMALAVAGCGSAPDVGPVAAAPETTAATSDASADVNLVTLRVPNMF